MSYSMMDLYCHYIPAYLPNPPQTTPRCYPPGYVAEIGKVINYYSFGRIASTAELLEHKSLVNRLPPVYLYGIRMRPWSDWYPDTPFTETMVGLYVKSPDCLTVMEMLIPYSEFNMDNVPWDKL